MIDQNKYNPDMDVIKANSKGQKYTILEEIELLRNGNLVSLVEPTTIKLVKATMELNNSIDLNDSTQRTHIYNINQLFLFATEILHSAENAESWMNEEIQALNCARPIDYLDTAAGIRWLESILINVNYGNYS